MELTTVPATLLWIVGVVLALYAVAWLLLRPVGRIRKDVACDVGTIDDPKVASGEKGSCYSNRVCSGTPLAKDVTVNQCHLDHDGKSWKPNSGGACKTITI